MYGDRLVNDINCLWEASVLWGLLYMHRLTLWIRVRTVIWTVNVTEVQTNVSHPILPGYHYSSEDLR